MAREALINIRCPHCLLDQKFTISLPRTYSPEAAVVRCFNAEEQQGCMEQFQIVQQVQVWSDKTDEQKNPSIDAPPKKSFLELP